MRLMGAMRWLPWRWMLRRAARSQGFLDPLALLARLRRFGQPAEVAEPIELLRAGMVFHARGLINTRVIQHNLDWIWPYWIEQQFNPHSRAFLPRAFSLTHVNLTHRNWTAVGRPDCAALPISDERGLITPQHDGWSVDAWIWGDNGERLYPSRLPAADTQQTLDWVDSALTLTTDSTTESLALTAEAWLERDAGGAVLCMRYQARADQGGRLVVALRPYNPEGIRFIEALQAGFDEAGDWGWWVEPDARGEPAARVVFDQPPSAYYHANYASGDVAAMLDGPSESLRVSQRCDTGLITAAAVFDLPAGQTQTRQWRLSLPTEAVKPEAQDWADALAGSARLVVPDASYQSLYDTAVQTLLLHSVEDIYPGPYTYRRFWFRDAAFIIHGLLNAGFINRSAEALARFPARQVRASGYFHSQDGEWDSNGQVLWIVARFYALTGEFPAPCSAAQWRRVLRRGARWIARKRLDNQSNEPHAGLLPAGFSAEHLGPNDYYYWDDDWSVAGLRAASAVLYDAGDAEAAAWMEAQAEDFAASIEAAHQADERRLGASLLPASPHRRMDAGAIGSVAIGYPLQSVAADDPRLLATVEHLLAAHCVQGGFFQEMIHSGVNAYLTLHLAQILLRAGDARGLELMDAVAALASTTGQWPEAIHPGTLGGCMGDGQHVWAAAEWVTMLRNAFCREESGGLVLGAGIQPRWLASGEAMAFGPTPTPHGDVSVTITPAIDGGAHAIEWQIDGDDPDWVQVALPGHTPVDLAGDARATSVRVAA